MSNPANKKADSSVPRHIAIIMDGNGRWATKRNLPRIAGHKKGADAVRESIEGCIENGVEYLTIYAFSSENWNRPQAEIDGLMELLQLYLGRELNKLHKNGVQLKVIGERSMLADNISEKISQAEELTKNNTKLCLTIALSYGSRQEIVSAAQKIAEDTKNGKISTADVNEDLFSSYLYTNGTPDPDLLIRTSGELRLSNFLLWQMAYTELLFIDILWPDFKKNNITEAVAEFTKRDRRYGTS